MADDSWSGVTETLNRSSKPPEVRAQLWMFAGPNGAGKSTLVADRLKGRLPTINPDDLALTLPDGRNRELEAGKLALEARRTHLEARRSFGLETTLTGRGELILLRQAATFGYKTNLVFVGLDAVELPLNRVAGRVSRGGHDVPEDALLRRFKRSYANLKEALMIVDRAFLVDNTGRKRRLVAIKVGNRLHRRSKLPPWALEARAGFRGEPL